MDRLAHRQYRLSGNAVTIGLSTVNWLLLMAMLSALLLATTVHRQQPVGTSSGISAAVAR